MLENERLRQHIERLFSDAPQTVKAVELKEEMLQNLTDKYNDLRAEGKTEDAAFNIAVASIGDVSELIRNTQSAPLENDKVIARRAILQAVAIGLYVLCAIPVIMLQSEIGLVLMFLMIALATGLLIYNGATEKARQGSDGTMVEDFKAWKQNSQQDQQAEKAISGSIWLIITCLYFALSFYTGAWHITWMVFLVGAALEQIIRGLFMLKTTKEKS